MNDAQADPPQRPLTSAPTASSSRTVQPVPPRPLTSTPTASSSRFAAQQTAQTAQPAPPAATRLTRNQESLLRKYSAQGPIWQPGVHYPGQENWLDTDWVKAEKNWVTIPRYHASGLATDDIVPPPGLRLDCFTAATLLAEAKAGRGGMSADYLHENWPSTFGAKYMINESRRPFGRPYVA